MFQTNKIPYFQKSLLTYINNGRLDKAKSIIQNMTNAHKLIDNFNCTLLHFAAECGNGGVAKYLIELGSDVNAQNSQGQTPLMLAVQKERVTTIRVLLENNANIHITNREGKSALHMVMHGSIISHSAIQAFLHQLKEETSHDNGLIAQKLRAINCPLRLAVCLGDVEVTRLMLDGGDCTIDQTDPETGETALHIAVRALSLEIVKLLIEYGANLNSQTATGYTPLDNLDVNSIEDSSLEILKILLDRGAMIFTEKDGEKRCQICCILERSCRKTINLLMQYDIDLCEVDVSGSTVLHYLARNKNVGVFDELQGKIFDVNIRNNMLYTPLQLVSYNHSSLKFLVNNGADVNASRNGVTPLSKIFQRISNCDRNHVDSVNILLQHGADPQSAFIDETIFDLAFNSFVLFEPVLAHLAIRDVSGTSISELIRSQIDRHDSLKRFYELCKSELNSMQKSTVWESITKYKLLIAGEKQLAMYLRRRDFRAVVSSNMFYFKSCYENLGRERIKKGISTAELWENSITTFCDALKLPYEKYYDVIENIIISYLSEQDMRNLCLLIEK